MRPVARIWYCLALVIALSATMARAAETFATIEFVEGSATVVSPDGTSRAAKVGMNVLEGDTLVTGANGELHARTADYGFVALRPDTRFLVEKIRANGDAGDGVAMRLLRGTFRSITGWIGKYQSRQYTIRTSVATIGVRGTDHEPMHLESDVPGAAAGTYDKVNSGATFIQGAAGSVDVAAGKAGFLGLHGTAPKVLDQVPQVYRRTANEERINRRKEELAKEVEHARAEAQRLAAERQKAQNKTESEAGKASAGEKAGSGEKSSTAEKSAPEEKKSTTDAPAAGPGEEKGKDREEHERRRRKHPTSPGH